MIPGVQPDLAIREGNWKLLCDYDGSNPQLYDLAQDRAETHNLAAKQEKVVKRLSAALLSWHQSMPPDNGPQLAAEKLPLKGKKKNKKAK